MPIYVFPIQAVIFNASRFKKEKKVFELKALTFFIRKNCSECKKYIYKKYIFIDMFAFNRFIQGLLKF